jgi:hypothetical protein
VFGSGYKKRPSDAVASRLDVSVFERRPWSSLIAVTEPR